MTKVVITIEGGSIQSVHTNYKDLDITVVDYDNLEENPVQEIEVDGFFKEGEAYKLWSSKSPSMAEIEVRDKLKELKV